MNHRPNHPASLSLADSCTVSGQPVVYSNPTYTRVTWRDVCVHLSRVRRYGGAHDWTVLDHLALGILFGHRRQVPSTVLGLFAGHDAAEYVLGDIHPRLKALMPAYGAIEEAWDEHVHQSLGLPWPLPRRLKLIVKYLDKRTLVTEMVHLGDYRSAAAEQRWGRARPWELDLARHVHLLPAEEKARLVVAAARSTAEERQIPVEDLSTAEHLLEADLVDFRNRWQS